MSSRNKAATKYHCGATGVHTNEFVTLNLLKFHQKIINNFAE